MTVANNDRVSSAGLKKFWQAAYNQIKNIFWKQGDTITQDVTIQRESNECCLYMTGGTGSLIHLGSSDSEVGDKGEFVINFAANYHVCALGCYNPLQGSQPNILNWVYNSDTETWNLTVYGSLEGNASTASAAQSGSALETAINGKVTANSAITGATKCKITYDSKGLVTAGSNLAASDIPNISTDKLTSGTLPISRGGTGATDAKGAGKNIILGANNGTNPADDEEIIASNSSTTYRYTFQELWNNYIKGKVTEKGLGLEGVKIGLWDVGDHSDSYTPTQEFLGTYTSFNLCKGGNFPSSPFVINVTWIVANSDVRFFMPYGGTLRIKNNRNSVTYCRCRGAQSSVAAGSTWDIPTVAGSVVTVHWNGGSAVWAAVETEPMIEPKINMSSTTHDAQYTNRIQTGAGATEGQRISAYMFTGSSSIGPCDDGICINFPWNESWGWQIILDGSYNRIYKRFNNDGTWTAWSQISTKERGTQVGNTMQPVYVEADGTITACNFYIA